MERRSVRKRRSYVNGRLEGTSSASPEKAKSSAVKVVPPPEKVVPPPPTSRVTYEAGIETNRDLEELMKAPDMTFVIGGAEYEVHSLLLKANSGYFSRMLEQDGFREARERRINIRSDPTVGITPDSIKCLIEFVYLMPFKFTDNLYYSCNFRYGLPKPDPVPYCQLIKALSGPAPAELERQPSMSKLFESSNDASSCSPVWAPSKVASDEFTRFRGFFEGYKYSLRMKPCDYLMRQLNLANYYDVHLLREALDWAISDYFVEPALSELKRHMPAVEDVVANEPNAENDDDDDDKQPAISASAAVSVERLCLSDNPDWAELRNYLLEHIAIVATFPTVRIARNALVQFFYANTVEAAADVSKVKLANMTDLVWRLGENPAVGQDWTEYVFRPILLAAQLELDGEFDSECARDAASYVEAHVLPLLREQLEQKQEQARQESLAKKKELERARQRQQEQQQQEHQQHLAALAAHQQHAVGMLHALFPHHHHAAHHQHGNGVHHAFAHAIPHHHHPLHAHNAPAPPAVHPPQFPAAAAVHIVDWDDQNAADQEAEDIAILDQAENP